MSSTSTDLLARVDSLAASLEPELIRVRRHLHAHPELSWHEHETQAFLSQWLESHGLEPHPIAKTGLYVDIGPPTAPIIYRADIDALPILDRKNPDHVPYASTRAGVCHACGHDVHSAIGAGVAALFGSLADDLPGRVRVVFQPAEEVLPSGAEAIVREGGIDGARAAFALHVDPTRETGTVGVRVGALTSATDAFIIRVIGKSGHSARPFLANDAVLAAADVVRAVYTIVPQHVDPMEPAVITIGRMNGGEAPNVIAGEMKLEGVLRCLDPDVRSMLHRQMQVVTEAAARVHDCRVELEMHHGAPPVMNDPELASIVQSAASDVLGEDHVHPIAKPSSGAEDFGRFGPETRTFMLRLGVRRRGDEIHHLHTPKFDVDERAMRHAVRIMSRSILRAFDTPGIGPERSPGE